MRGPSMRSLCLVALFLILFSHEAPARTDYIHTWELAELTFTTRTEYQNGYVQGFPDSRAALSTVSFTGVSGEASGLHHSVAMFWDGGNTWKVRFSPPRSGDWNWVVSSGDPELHGASGRLRAAEWSEEEKLHNPTRRGLVKVSTNSTRPGRYFEYGDGTPFLWVADTWWRWTNKNIKFSSFKKLVDDRVEKGFTVGLVFFSPGSGLTNATYDMPNLRQIADVERMIAYANEKGIVVSIQPWWSEKDMQTKVGGERMRRWWRYVIARLSGFNVVWVVAGEYNKNNYGGFGLDFWKDLGLLIRHEDPHHRLLSAHPTPPGWSGGAEAPQWSSAEVLHQESWLDYNQIQVGHARWRNEMTPSLVSSDYKRRPQKPTIVVEPWYEFVENIPSARQIRFAAWSAMLSGAAGHSYGGGHVWRAHLPESPSTPDSWPFAINFENDTLDYPGARSMSFLAKFLKSIRWWELEPTPELVLDYPVPLCAASPGREYLVYLRYGGVMKVDLRQSAVSDEFEYVWFDMESGTQQKGGRIKGGSILEFKSPDKPSREMQYKDWLLYIKLSSRPSDFDESLQ